MPSFNGHVTSLTIADFLGVSTSVQAVDPSIHGKKWFNQGTIACRTIDGVSGTFFVDVYGSVGGATFLIGGLTAVSAVGNVIIGTTGTAGMGTLGTGFPPPTKVVFGSASGVSGFTASIYLAGEYS